MDFLGSIHSSICVFLIHVHTFQEQNHISPNNISRKYIPTTPAVPTPPLNVASHALPTPPFSSIINIHSHNKNTNTHGAPGTPPLPSPPPQPDPHKPAGERRTRHIVSLTRRTHTHKHSLWVKY
ncbi:hypothetical protein E2C01_083465 [Portunus trituberculatus]|uniref:Uncharacterized protein n=1 Tax=Portunus trituberculatus TaxID=210409 RepID=A0A5B7J1B2_PORTR|nr:hypothetical protein [Portunus trituberculatus]